MENLKKMVKHVWNWTAVSNFLQTVPFSNKNIVILSKTFCFVFTNFEKKIFLILNVGSQKRSFN